MANEEHLALLKAGVLAWNAWCRANFGSIPDLTGANFSESDLEGVHLRRADLQRADLSGTILSNATLFRATLRGADLSGAILSEADLEEADLREAFLFQANLRGADLSGADLRRAILSAADIQRADLEGIKLSGASLEEANLQGANLRTADLSGADLSGADLSGADLSGADLSGADLSRAKINRTVLTNVDLRAVQGLETIQHIGPSSIGIDTIYRSGGKIPAAFLRGCGVPESLIDYIPALVGALEPIQYYSCFISYSSQNEEFARRLHGRMQQEDLRVWFAPEDLKGGQPLEEQIHQAIHIYDKLLLVLSESSLPAKWVISELRKGRQAELIQNRRQLFPIRLVDMRVIEAWECYDRESESDLAAEVRAYYIPDFSQWKNHDTFEAAFAKLLAALKAVDERPVRRDLAPLIARKRRELRVLELQHATTGIHTPPHVVIAIEDLRREIVALEEAQGKTGANEPQP